MLDDTGSAIEASGSLLSQAIQFKQTFSTDDQGRFIARNLPFGVYRLNIERQGFGSFSALVEIRSEVPLDYPVTLRVAPIETAIVVKDSATLLDPHRTAPVYYIGDDTLRDRLGATPGRAVLDLVVMQPGWILEANGVLHPRGAEYNTQYVVDGFPVVDNRSPAFAPGLDVDEVQSMNVRTAGYPAEYGRKLGGVIEVTTKEDTRAGWHGSAVFDGASFSTAGGDVAVQYARGRTVAGASLDSAHTGRYLDPPVPENYTNNATGGGGSAHFATGFSEKDRLRVAVSSRRTGFLVPDERLQFTAGQRQDRRNDETEGQISYQRTLAPWLVANIRAAVRDLSADLWSNPLATPILAGQQRGFRESYAGGSISAHRGAHEWKAGGEVIRTAIHESFDYRITDPEFFAPDVPPVFNFADRRTGLEESAFVQDMIRAGRWTFSAGIRWDGYRLLVRDSAVSPRLSAAWYWPRAGLVLRASYDRAFEVPAIENLLYDLSERTGIVVRLEGNAEGSLFREPLTTAVYRMVQEALTNVARHAGATSVEVDLQVRDDTLHVRVKDNGRGFQPDPARKSYGVLGIRERAATLGGSSRIHTPPEGGTLVEIEVPLKMYSAAGAVQ